jgi:hypothetical protein
MSALFNATNINQARYFFATSQNGEQVLDLEFGTTGGSPNLSTMAVAISGDQGNAVVVNQAPQFIATEFAVGEDALIAGTNSSYFTLSTLATNLTGINLSIDRINGSGIACVESYATNGSVGGFEFLSRGVNSALISTPINAYLSTIGSPGAVAKIGSNGQFVAGQGVVAPVEVALSAPDTGNAGVGAFTISDLSGGNALSRWSFYKYGVPGAGNTGSDLALGSYDNTGTFISSCLTATRATGKIATINSYAYPQTLLSTLGVANQTGVSVPAASPTVIYTITNPNLTPNGIYLCDVGFSWQVGSPGATGNWIELGLRLGSNGSFNYDVPQYIPPGGTGTGFISNSVSQITDMGNVNTNIDVIAYHNNATPISISTNTISGGNMNYFKMIT